MTTAGHGDVDHYTDFDGDGLNDYYEYRLGRHPWEIDDPAVYDTDADGDTLTVLQEQQFGSNPFLVDSDDDGLADNLEVAGWNTALHGQVTNPNYSIAHWDGNTTTPNLALDLAQVAAAAPGGIVLPKPDRFVSISGSYSLEAWFKPAAANSGTLMRLYSTIKNDGTADNATVLALGLQAGKAIATTAGATATGSTVLAADEWHHLCAVLDYAKGTVAIIVNGMEINSTAVSAMPVYGYMNGLTLTLGGDGAASFADGLLDEVKVFNSARAITAVNAQRFVAADQQTLGLVAYYRFNDAGATIEDFTHPHPAALGDRPAAYALAHPTDPSKKTSEWLADSDAPVANELPGAIPNWWASLYRTAGRLGVREFQGHYYEVAPTKLSWTDSRNAAAAAGGTLAIIGSAAENAFLASNLLSGRRGIWLGLTDEDVEGEFIWIDGTPLAGNYSNWSTQAVGGQTNEPNNGFWDGVAHAAENYAFLVGAGKTNPRLVVGYWNDATNVEQHDDQDSYIIEYRNYLNVNQAGDADWDGDGLSNYYEYLVGTNPLRADTDNDGLADSAEHFGAYEMPNLIAQQYGTIPQLTAGADLDNDGVSDFTEYDNGAGALDAAYNSRRPLALRELVLDGGGSYVNLPDLHDYALATYTFEAWLKPDVNGQGVLIQRQVATNAYNYSLSLTAQGALQMTFHYEDESTVKEQTVATKDDLVVMDGATWTHIAVRMQKKAPIAIPEDAHKYTLTFFVNGRPVETTLDLVAFDVLYAPLRWAQGPAFTRIGSATVGAGFTGAMFEWRLWNVARSNAAIYTNYNAELAANDRNGLFAWFRFDDGPERQNAIDAPYGQVGDTVENFARAQDWLSGWRNAGRLANATIQKALTLPFATDSDNDGIADWWEHRYFAGIDTVNRTSDYDGDGLTDYYEYLIGRDPTNPYSSDDPTVMDGDYDSDGDGLTDRYEAKYGSDPAKADTDDDGISDKLEVVFGSSPVHPMSISVVKATGEKLDAVYIAKQRAIITPRLAATMVSTDGTETTWNITYTETATAKQVATVTYLNAEAADANAARDKYLAALNDYDVIWLMVQHGDDPNEYVRNFRAEGAPSLSLNISQKPFVDGSAVTDYAELPHPDRFAVGPMVINPYGYNETISGDFTLEMWVKHDSASTHAGRSTIFEVLGNTKTGFRLVIDDGAPLGEIFDATNSAAGEVLAYVGGKHATPRLEDGVWTHLALVWAPATKSLALYRDRLAIMGSQIITYVIDFGTIAEYARLYAVNGMAIDEFRFWTSARTDEQIDYWSSRIVPSPLRSDALPIVEPRYMRKMYSLRAYYRFDDGGALVEDFAHFGDQDYMLQLVAPTPGYDPIIAGENAKTLDGVDDVDGDGIPEWWVYFHDLDTFEREAYIPNELPSGDWRNALQWNTEGTAIVGLHGHVQNVGYTSFGGSNDPAAVGQEEGAYQTDFMRLDGDFKYVTMFKYFNLSSTPVRAIMGYYNRHGVTISGLTVNGRQVGNYSHGYDIAPYLQVGRNQIVVSFVRAQRPDRVYRRIPTPANPANTVDYNRKTYIGSLDVSLTVDGQPVIVFGHDYNFDPRSVWYYRACTADEIDLRVPGFGTDFGTDDNGYVLGGDTGQVDSGTNPYAYNYGMKMDEDGDDVNVYYEYLLGTNPKSRDSDNNGIFDGEEDYDGDGINNRIELASGTDPMLRDTDNDGRADNVERAETTDPLNMNDPLIHRALYTDGAASSFLLLPNQARFGLLTWTVEAWVRPDADLANGTIIERVVGTMTGKTLVNFSMRLVDGRLTMVFTDLNGGQEVLSVPQAYAAPADVWTHLAMTYEGDTTTIALYVNGENVAQSYSRRQPVSTGPGVISVRAGSGFQGYIDDLRIWNTVRSSDDIADHRAVLLSGGEAGLAAYYRFDDGDLDSRTTTAFAGGTYADFAALQAAVAGGTAVYPPYILHLADSVAGSAQDWKNNWRNAAVLQGAAIVVDISDSNPFEAEADSNYNQIPDRWEYKFFGQLLTDDNLPTGKYGDFDGDGLSNYYEYLAGLDPKIRSTDGKVFDNIADSDGDGLNNMEEQELGLHPGLADSDDDGYTDGGSVTITISENVGVFTRVITDVDGYVLSNVEIPATGFNSADYTLVSGTPGTDAVYARTLTGEPSSAAAAWSQAPVQSNGYARFAAHGDKVTYRNWRRRLVGNTMVTTDPFAFAGNFTVEFKFRGASNPNGVLLRKGAAVSGLTHYRIVLRTDGRVAFTVGSNTLTSTVAIPDATTWVHVAAVVNGRTMTLTLAWKAHVEAEEYLEYTISGSRAGTMPDSRGTDVVLGGGSFLGAIDDLRLWNVARPAASITADRDSDWAAGDIADLIANQGPALPAGLVLYSTFNDRGTTAENFAAARISLINNPAVTLPDLAMAGVFSGAEFASELQDTMLDVNENKIADDWEYLHFGRLLAPGEEFSDPDKDGLNNLYEFLSSTNPNDAAEGPDGHADTDNLTNLQEQLAGTDPRAVDTDDDGMSDYDEILVGRNPLSSDDNIANYYFKVLDGQTVTFPGADLAIAGNFSVSFWVRLDDLSDATFVSRVSDTPGLDQFKVALTGGQVVFSIGLHQLASEALTGAGWHQISASLAGTALSLTVSYDELGNDVYVDRTVTGSLFASDLPVSTGKDVVIGSVGAFGIDDFVLVSGAAAVITADFDDLGLTAENRNGALMFLMPGKTYRDPETSGVFSELHNGLKPLTHQGFTPNDRVWDTNNNRIADDWEQEYFDRLLAAGEELEDFDGDGLNNLYEYLSGTNPKKVDTDGDSTADAAEDFDGDGLTNYYEQLYGTDPRAVDTDDDGVTDHDEVLADRDPLSSDDSTINHYLLLPATAWVTYPGADLAVDRNFSISFWGRVINADLGTGAAVLVERAADVTGSQFKVELTAAGEVKFTVGAVSVTSDAIAVNPLRDYTWFQVQAVFAGNALTLTVSDDEQGDGAYADHVFTAPYNASSIPVSTGKNVLLGNAGNAISFGMDDLVLTVGGAQVLASDFNDLGATFENRAGALVFLMPGMTYRDPETAGVPSAGAVVGTGTVADPFKHAWFQVSDRTDDANDNDIPDSWEQEHFGRLLTAGEEFADFDGDGLNNLYEYLSGTDPNVVDTDGDGVSDADEDFDGDGLTNLQEQGIGTLPNEVDSDDDWLSDYVEFNTALDPMNPFNPANNRVLDLIQSAHTAYSLDAVQTALAADGRAPTDASNQVNIAARVAPYAQVEGFAGVASARSYTLEMWFYLAEDNAKTGNLLVRTNRDDPAADGDFRLYLDNGKLMLAYNVMGSAAPGGVQTRTVLSLNDELTFAHD